MTARMPSGSAGDGAAAAATRWRTISSRKNGLPLVSCHSARSASLGHGAAALNAPTSSAASALVERRAAGSSRRSARAAGPRARRSSAGGPLGVAVWCRRSAAARRSSARTTWRSSSSVGLSAQCRSSRISTVGPGAVISLRTRADGVEEPVALGRPPARSRWAALAGELGEHARELAPRGRRAERAARAAASRRRGAAPARTAGRARAPRRRSGRRARSRRSGCSRPRTARPGASCRCRARPRPARAGAALPHASASSAKSHAISFSRPTKRACVRVEKRGSGIVAGRCGRATAGTADGRAPGRPPPAGCRGAPARAGPAASPSSSSRPAAQLVVDAHGLGDVALRRTGAHLQQVARLAVGGGGGQGGTAALRVGERVPAEAQRRLAGALERLLAQLREVAPRILEPLGLVVAHEAAAGLRRGGARPLACALERAGGELPPRLRERAARLVDVDGHAGGELERGRPLQRPLAEGASQLRQQRVERAGHPGGRPLAPGRGVGQLVTADGPVTVQRGGR